jgi:hypothetical protein
MILLISASCVARIIGMSHWHLEIFIFLFLQFSKTMILPYFYTPEKKSYLLTEMQGIVFFSQHHHQGKVKALLITF